jgi:hypothetical protein
MFGYESLPGNFPTASKSNNKFYREAALRGPKKAFQDASHGVESLVHVKKAVRKFFAAHMASRVFKVENTGHRVSVQPPLVLLEPALGFELLK